MHKCVRVEYASVKWSVFKLNHLYICNWLPVCSQSTPSDSPLPQTDLYFAALPLCPSLLACGYETSNPLLVELQGCLLMYVLEQEVDSDAMRVEIFE